MDPKLGAKILIIEDDPDITSLMAVLLRSSGYSVRTAADGVVAVIMARQETPDLVVLDLGLPGGGGLVVLDRLRAMESTAATPVLVVSAFGGSYPDSALAHGAQRFLQKPFDPDEFLLSVSDLLI